jgi:hypothetical protein
MRSLAMLTQRLRAGLIYGAALRLGWLSLRRVRFFGEKCDAIFGDAKPALTRWANLWRRLAWVVGFAEGSVFWREARCDRALPRAFVLFRTSCDAIVFCGSGELPHLGRVIYTHCLP